MYICIREVAAHKAQQALMVLRFVNCMIRNSPRKMRLVCLIKAVLGCPIGFMGIRLRLRLRLLEIRYSFQQLENYFDYQPLA